MTEHHDITSLEQRYRLLFEWAGDAIVVLREMVLIDCNTAALSLFRCTRDEFLGGTPADYSPSFQSDGSPSSVAARDHYIAVLNEGVQQFFWTHKRRDGTLFYASVTLASIPLPEGEHTLGIVRDVSQENADREALHNSEVRFRALFNAIPFPATLMDAVTGRFFQVNQAAAREYQFSEEEMHGLLLENLSDEEERTRQRMATLCAGRPVSATMIYHRRKDGSRFPVESILGRFEADGQPYLYGITRDVTERMEALHRIENKEARYRALFNSFPDAVLLQNNKLEILDCNDAALTMFGYSRAELLGLTVPELMAPGETERLQQIQDELRRNGTLETHVKGIRRNGSSVLLETHLTRLPLDGELLVYACLRDVTEEVRNGEERRRNQEMLQQIFASSPYGILVFDHTGQIVECNDQVLKLHGYDRSEIGHLTAYDLIDERWHEEGTVELGNLSRNGSGVRRLQFLMKRKDGSTFPGEVSAAVMTDRQGNPAGIVGIAVDISDRREAQQKLEHSRHELRKLSEHLQEIRENERKRISREVHDELGQSLTALKLDLAWLRKRPAVDEDVQGRLDGMEVVVSDLMTRVKKIAADLRPGVLDDLGLAAAVEWEIAKFREHSGVIVQFSIIPSELEVDESIAVAVFRILQEGLTNIARHSNAGTVTVDIIKDDSSIRLTIKDDGIGIRTDDMSRKDSFGLLGIRERVIPLGGTFEVEGTPGTGTCLKVFLPLLRE
jgi:PAS domain S-box-containing protein